MAQALERLVKKLEADDLKRHAVQVKFSVVKGIEKGVFVPGEGVLSVVYKNKTFLGDLLPDGTIRDKVGET